MPLDAQTQAQLDLMASFPPMVLNAALIRSAERYTLPDPALERMLVAKVTDQRIAAPEGHEIPVRIYHPRPADRLGATPPMLLYFHGGGFTLGSLDGWDGLCCQLCKQSGCIVISVDYRLAPEYKFPAAPDDCYTALLWAAANASALGGDASKIAVAGDSAGGNLAAVVCLKVQEAQDPAVPAIGYQILFYPTTEIGAETPSRQRNLGYLLTKDMMAWFNAQYFSNQADRHHPHASPLKAQSHTGLPPALIITAEYDPLLDEGANYAASLRAAGVPVEYLCMDGTIHGFISFYRMIEKGREAIALAGARVRGVFG